MMAQRSARAKQTRSGLKPLGGYLPGIAKKAFERHGLAYFEIAQSWPDIVGAEIARYSSPERIRWPRGKDAGFGGGGVLIIRVSSPRAIELQHRAPEIIDRLNQYYGYRALAEIKIVQGPLPERTGDKEERGPETGGEASADAADGQIAGLDRIEDDRLKQVLSRLGRRVVARE